MTKLFLNKKQPHIFLHIHKSGGTSLMNTIDVNYNKKNIHVINGKTYRASYQDFKGKDKSYRNKIDLLRGHHFFGSHKYLRGNAMYFTMLREPVSRLCSLYNYLLEIDLYKPINEEKMSFKTFLESGLAMAADNGMTRMLTNHDFDKVPNGEVNENLSEEAIENLENYFVAVGLTEHFEASLELFKTKLDWKKIPILKVDNSTKHKKISKKEVEAIFITNQELNRFIAADLKVYQYAKQRFFKEVMI
ncbi:sulfotransferase family protein [Flavobacteriaceae bacterium GSB9]|nr:sulfotransferase family protein [Flavobacteriaceae bacterium GSB9]